LQRLRLVEPSIENRAAIAAAGPRPRGGIGAGCRDTLRVRSPITSTTAPVSAAAEQQHDYDDNQN
jgi:hypothetical protein